MINVIVAYDVHDNDNRAHLAALLGAHGVRLQKSVFECLLEETVLAELLQTTERLLDLHHDVLHVFRQCEPCFGGRHTQGQAKSILHELFWIV
jgi:CRISPR-associated protein Cas2